MSTPAEEPPTDPPADVTPPPADPPEDPDKAELAQLRKEKADREKAERDEEKAELQRLRDEKEKRDKVPPPAKKDAAPETPTDAPPAGKKGRWGWFPPEVT